MQLLRGIFDRFMSDADGNSRENLFWLFVVALCFMVGVLAIGILPVVFAKDWSGYGDFVGGVLGPILTFITFMGLLITIVLQQTELRETRTELAKSADALDGQLTALTRQNFEATFFQMLTLHNTMVSSMDIHRKNQVTLEGRDCFRFFAERLSNIYHYERSSDSIDIKDVYADFWNDHHQNLGYYFRYLYYYFPYSLFFLP